MSPEQICFVLFFYFAKSHSKEFLFRTNVLENVGKEGIDGEWAGSNFLVISRGQLTSPTLQGVHIRLQLPLQEVNENIDIWGPHFRSRTSILLTQSILPNILLRTKNDKHRQRVFRSSEHKCTYLYPDLGTNNGHKLTSLDWNKYINLGATKKSRGSLPTLYSIWLVTCTIFLVLGPSQYQPCCWMGHPGEIKFTLRYLSLPYKSGNTNEETWLCDMSCSKWRRKIIVARILAGILARIRARILAWILARSLAILAKVGINRESRRKWN